MCPGHMKDIYPGRTINDHDGHDLIDASDQVTVIVEHRCHGGAWAGTGAG